MGLGRVIRRIDSGVGVARGRRCWRRGTTFPGASWCPFRDSPGVDGGLDVRCAVVSSREVSVMNRTRETNVSHAVRSSLRKGEVMVKLQMGPCLTALTGLVVDKATLAAIALIDLSANRGGYGA